MNPSVSILVSYHPDGAYRDLSWIWAKQRWEKLFPNYPIIVGDVIGINGFQQTASYNQAASQSNTDVYILIDCDTATDPEWIREAVIQISNEEISWALYSQCHKLTRESTAHVLQSDPAVEPFPPYETELITVDISPGGVLVVPRRGFEEVGGYDERFTVWGAYDSCFNYAMDTLWGKHKRFESTIYHLWHPYDNKELFGHPAQSEQQVLTERYVQANGNEKLMREVRFG